MWRWSTAIVCALVLSSVGVARADDPDPCEGHPGACIGHWPTMVIRVRAGGGALLNGGAVTSGAAPNLLEHARFIGELGVDVGARPFGGGAIIGLGLTGQVGPGAALVSLGLTLDYDLFYLWDRDPDRMFGLAFGGSLAMDFAVTDTLSSAGVTWQYMLLRPDWRAYVELRIRASASIHAIVRAQVVTGFDDLLDLASATLTAGCEIDAF
jgi:hypothetical protein